MTRRGFFAALVALVVFRRLRQTDLMLALFDGPTVPWPQPSGHFVMVGTPRGPRDWAERYWRLSEDTLARGQRAIWEDKARYLAPFDWPGTRPYVRITGIDRV